MSPQTYRQTCSGISTRYAIIVVTDAVIDVLLIILPAFLVWKLQMSAKLKLQVVSVFAFRLPLLVFSVLGLVRFNSSLRDLNPGVARTGAVVYQQSELCWSLLSATVPCLKSFIRSFDTGSGVKVNYTSNAYGSSGHSKGESYRMQSLSSGRSPLQSANEDGAVKVNHRPFGHQGHTRGLGSKARGESTSKVTALPYSTDRPKDADATSTGSQELFIRRDVQWEIRSENFQP